MAATQEIIFTNNVSDALREAVGRLNANRVFILTDEQVNACVLNRMGLPDAEVICIPCGDEHKTLATAEHVWKALEHGGTRKSALVNIGGGVVTDLGGFAAGTFKRGIRFLNVPTTLLAAVDAAVGGKTGVNFNGLKNEIGLFKEAETVIISSAFFDTLPETELKSGYAEMLKHGLLSGETAYRPLLDFDFNCVASQALLDMLEQSVGIKRRIVEADPFEKGLRRALNLGHTAGHAFESKALRDGHPIPHGYAVAWGLIVEAVISHTEKGFPSQELYRLAEFVRLHYGAFPVSCDDYPMLLELMRHDKKSENGECNFTLLRNIGEVETGCTVAETTVEAALDIYRDLLHI